jgi:Arc/MetJ-type ribon-helix-helix transcriptional regulator
VAFEDDERMNGKQRLSASVDADLVEAAEHAVAAGRSASVSAWVNDALRLKVAQDRRLEALAGFVAAYESEYGEITQEEMDLAARRARGRAVVVREVARPARPAARSKRRVR